MTPCLEFSGLKDSKGYGRVWINGKKVFAHRFAYCVAKGIQLEDIDGLVIRHACDNPSCILPSHLCAGTSQQNANDMVERKRQAFGSRNGRAKLTEDDVRNIISEYIPRHPLFNTRALSKKYGVTPNYIAAICRGEKWKHIKK